jgi:CRP/FNR family transcriptional regulator, cyclic AMP receptor protein
MSTVERARAARVWFAVAVDNADILAMTAQHGDTVVADGERLLEQGVRSSSLYVLVSGALDVQRRGRTVVQMDEPGTLVGEMGLLLRAPASADVVAVGETRVRRLDDAEELFERNPDFSRFVATMLARRLLEISSYLSDLQEQFADRSDILGLVPTVLADLLGGRRATPETGSDREPDSPY